MCLKRCTETPPVLVHDQIHESASLAPDLEVIWGLRPVLNFKGHRSFLGVAGLRNKHGRETRCSQRGEDAQSGRPTGRHLLPPRQERGQDGGGGGGGREGGLRLNAQAIAAGITSLICHKLKDELSWLYDKWVLLRRKKIRKHLPTSDPQMKTHANGYETLDQKKSPVRLVTRRWLVTAAPTLWLQAHRFI